MLLVAMHLIVPSSYLLLVVRPGATISVVEMRLVPSSFLLLVVGPGATSSVHAPSSDAPCS